MQRCTQCGQEFEHLTMLSGEDLICDSCLETNFERCSVCGEYYDLSSVEFEVGEDGLVCEYCWEDMQEDE